MTDSIPPRASRAEPARAEETPVSRNRSNCSPPPYIYSVSSPGILITLAATHFDIIYRSISLCSLRTVPRAYPRANHTFFFLSLSRDTNYPRCRSRPLRLSSTLISDTTFIRIFTLLFDDRPRTHLKYDEEKVSILVSSNLRQTWSHLPAFLRPDRNPMKTVIPASAGRYYYYYYYYFFKFIFTIRFPARPTFPFR